MSNKPRLPRFTLQGIKALVGWERLTEDSSRLAITLAVFCAVFVFFHFDFLKRFELVTYDYRCILRGTRPADPRIVVVEISDDSIAKIGRWPWDRDWHATMVKILTELGAKAIVFDVIFSEPSDPAKDDALAEAIKRSGRVYLAEVFEDASNPGGQATLLTSLSQFSRDAKGEGHINLRPDTDGVMRRIPVVYGQAKLPQLSLAVALDEFGADKKRMTLQNGRLSIPAESGVLTYPVDAKGNFIINWVGRWRETFVHYSYIDVITSYVARQKGGKPHVPLETLKDKICYIGTSAAGLFDIRPTPLEPAYPAVGVNLTVLNNLLEGRFVARAGYVVELALLAFYVAILFKVMKLQSYTKAAGFTLALAVGHVLVASLLFIHWSVWVNVVYPLLLIFLMYFCVTLYNQLSIAIERAKLLKLATRDSLTGLFNIGHFKLLLKAEITTISLRREKNLSLVMGDVDNFKKTNDTYGHVTGDSVLKEVASCVRSNCRALDVAARYGGEEFILMLPGANVDQAFKVAESIRKAIAEKNFYHEKGDFKTSISIGVTQVSPDDKDLEAIVARADRALYEAKHTGKNKVVIAGDSPRISLA